MVVLVISVVILLVGVYGCIWHDKLNNHKPFSEVDFIDYLTSALAACWLTPAGVFGIFAGVLILIN